MVWVVISVMTRPGEHTNAHKGSCSVWAIVDVEESVAGMIKVIKSATRDMCGGKFIDYKGQPSKALFYVRIFESFTLIDHFTRGRLLRN
jgi:hypothetical protein